MIRLQIINLSHCWRQPYSTTALDIHYSSLDTTYMIVSIKNHVLKMDVSVDLIYPQKPRIVQILSLHLKRNQYGSLLTDLLKLCVLLNMLQREILVISS